MPFLTSSDIFDCPVCGKAFRSSGALESHLSMARSCKWWNSQSRSMLLQGMKVGDVAINQVDDNLNNQPPSHSPLPPSFNWHDPDWEDLEDEEGFEGLYQDELELLLSPPNSGPTGGGDRRLQRVLSRALLAEEAPQYIDHHQKAGSVLSNSRMDIDSDTASDGTSPGPDVYSPFNRETDWRIAEWAIKDSPGHSSLDRLLSIPNVRPSLISRVIIWLIFIRALGCRKFRFILPQCSGPSPEG